MDNRVTPGDTIPYTNTSGSTIPSGRLVATGHTNAQIARELFVSPRTVDMHVRNVLSKLGCTTRVAAAWRAAELRLVDIPGVAGEAST